MTKEELKNQITELKENCKKLAEEYRERYNQDNEDKIALNMFYHNVISYNDYESVLALIGNRNSTIMCFSAPPVLTEETVEVNLKRIAELEKENAELKGLKDVATLIRANNDTVVTLMQLNNKLVSKSQQLTKAKEIIRSLYFIIQGRIDYKGNIPLEDEMYRANQFLNSEVEK